MLEGDVARAAAALEAAKKEGEAKRVQEADVLLSHHRQQREVAEADARRLGVLPPQTGPLGRSFAAVAVDAAPATPRGSVAEQRQRPSPAGDQGRSPELKRRKEEVYTVPGALPLPPWPLLREATTPERRVAMARASDGVPADFCEEIDLEGPARQQNAGVDVVSGFEA